MGVQIDVVMLMIVGVYEGTRMMVFRKLKVKRHCTRKLDLFHDLGSASRTHVTDVQRISRECNAHIVTITNSSSLQTTSHTHAQTCINVVFVITVKIDHNETKGEDLNLA